MSKTSSVITKRKTSQSYTSINSSGVKASDTGKSLDDIFAEHEAEKEEKAKEREKYSLAEQLQELDLNGAIDSLNSASYSTKDSLQGASDTITKYRDLYSQYAKLSGEEFDSTDFDNAISSAKSLSDYYSQWETEDDYNAAVEAYENQQKLLELDVDKEQSEIDELKKISAEKQAESQKNTAKETKSGILAPTTETTKGTAIGKNDVIVDSQLEDYNGDELRQEIAARERNLNLAKDLQKVENLQNNALNAEDYQTYVEKGLALEPYDFNTTLVNLIKGKGENKATASREYAADVGASAEKSLYAQMTDDEVNVYSYYLAKEKEGLVAEGTSDRYLEALNETLSQRESNQIYGMYLEDNAVAELIFSAAAGLDQFASGISNLPELITGEDTYTSPIQYASQAAKENLVENAGGEDSFWGTIAGGAYDLSTTTWNMIPTIAVSAAMTAVGLPGGNIVGTALMGASAGGNTYNDMLQQGYSVQQAQLFATASGVWEGMSEYYLGSLESLGGNAISKSVIGKKLTSALSGGFKAILSFGLDMAQEGAEEVIQDFGEKFLKKVILGESEQIDWSEEAYSFILGALSAGVLNGTTAGVNAVANYTQSRVDAKSIIENGRQAQLANAGTLFSASSKASQLTSKINENSSVGEIAKALRAVNAEIDKANQADISHELQLMGWREADANSTAEWLAASVYGYDMLTTEQKKVLESNPDIKQAFINAIQDKNSTINQRLTAIAQSKGADVSYGVDFEKIGQTEKFKKAIAAQAEAAKEADTAEQVARVVATGDVSKNGNATIKKSGKNVKIKSVKSIENGTMILNLADGTTVNSRDVSYANSNQAQLYESVLRVGYPATTANAIINGYNATSNMSVQDYLLGVNEAYNYGMWNGSRAEISKNGFASNLTSRQIDFAYNMGKADAETSAKTAQAEQDAKKTKSSKETRQGTIHTEAVVSELSETQKVSVEALTKVVAETTHNDVYFFESVVKDGKRVLAKDIDAQHRAGMKAPNGFYEPGTGRIYIDINAGMDGEGAILFTATHELTHFIREWSPAKFKILADFLVEEYGKRGISVQQLANAQMRKAKEAGHPISTDTAYEEVVADSMQSMLTDTNALEKLSELKAKDKSLVAKIRDFFKDFLTKIKAAYKGVKLQTQEQVYVSQMTDAIERLSELFTDALADAGETFQAINAQLSDNGIEVSDSLDAGSLNSVRYVLDDDKRAKTAKLLAKRFDVTEEEATNWLSAEISLASLILNPKYSKHLDYVGDSGAEAIKKNSDYPQGTVDFSNICKKRRAFTEVMNKVLAKFPNHVFQATDLAKIRTIMGEEGMTLPCGLCYVEDRRQLDSIVADDFRSALALYRSGSTINPAGKPFNANQLKALKLTDGDTYTPSVYELVSLEGLNKLKAKNPTMAEAWHIYNNARGMQAVRLLENEAEYKRQILGYSATEVKRKNDLGGLRIYSFSDMEMFHLIDIIQVLSDCAAVGLSVQGYTKVNEYAKAVKDTGEKLNRSLIPLGVLGYHMEGDKVILDFDTVEGIDINSKDFFDSTDNPNIGNILIGINYAQVRAAMTSTFVDQIIPFHTGQSSQVLKEKGLDGWNNYKNSQGEKDLATGKRASRQVNFYTEVIQALEAEGKKITERSFTEKFLEVCKGNNLEPRFSEFLDKDAEGNYIFTKGYYKLLADFKLFNQITGEYLPQTPVKPIFDNSYLTQLLKDYAETKDASDAEFADKLPKVTKRIADEIINADSGASKYSLRDVTPVQPTNDEWQRSITTEEAMAIYPKLWDVTAEESEKRNPTQVTNTVKTYNKIYDILKADGFGGEILDASSGLGVGTESGRKNYGFSVDDIEPYPGEGYKPKYKDYSKLTKKYDAIISNAVLNVLPQDQRDALVVKMGELLQDGGKMYVSVRSLGEIKNLAKNLKNIKVSESETIETTRGSYQKGFTKTELVAYLKDALGKGFKVASATEFGDVAAVVTKTAEAKYSTRDYFSDESFIRLKDENLLINAVYETIRAAGKTFNPYTITDLYASHPELDYIERLQNGDTTAKEELTDLVGKLTTTLEVFDFRWFVTEAHPQYTNQYEEVNGQKWFTGAISYKKAHAKGIKALRDICDKRMEEVGDKGGTNLNIKNNASVDIGEIESLFYRMNSNAQIAELAKKVFPVAKKLNLAFRFTDKGASTARTGQQANQGFYLANKSLDTDRSGLIVYRTSTFNSTAVDDQRKATVLLHELIHACTIYGFYGYEKMYYRMHHSVPMEIVNGIAAIDNMYRFVAYSASTAALDIRKEYGLSNKYEFLAELSNPNFRSKLEGLQSLPDSDEVDWWLASAKINGINVDPKNKIETGALAILDHFLDNFDQAAYDELTERRIVKDVGIKYSDRDTATFNGKAFWSGAVNLSDGVIEETHTAEEAKNAGYHHSFYFTDNAVEKINDGEYGFFWVDEDGDVQGEWREDVSKKILSKIKSQIQVVGNERYSDRVLMGSYFSGGGTLEEGLVYKMLDHEFAVEYDGKIAAVWQANHGNSMWVGDVRDFDSSTRRDVFYFHASPSCQNTSKMNNKRLTKNDVDYTTAEATAKALREKKPPVFTCENVAEYIGTPAYKIITDALDELGYEWDVDVYKASDYGNATKRQRMVIRAVEKGLHLPPKPEKITSTATWGDVTRDLWDGLEQTSLAPNLIDAIRNTPKLKNLFLTKATKEKALMIYGTSKSHYAMYAWEDELAPTLTTKCGDARIIIDGKVYKPTPQFMGRIQGLPDDYKYPKEKTRAYKVIGNGIPTQLTNAVMGGVLESAYEQTHGGEKLYSNRDNGYAPVFYSQMGKVVDGIKTEKVGANSVVNYLKGKGVKDEEIKWSGIQTFLEGKKSVTKQELQEFIQGSMLRIEETERNEKPIAELDEANIKYRGETVEDFFDGAIGEFEYNDYISSIDESLSDKTITKGQHNKLRNLADAVHNLGTKWRRYTASDATNYRELLFVMPDSSYSNNAMRTHWNRDGVLAHARIDDQEMHSGEKMLFIEEIQSDWHNEGSKEGYASDDIARKLAKNLWADVSNRRIESQEALEKYKREVFNPIENPAEKRISEKLHLASWAIFASLTNIEDEYGVSKETAEQIRAEATEKELANGREFRTRHDKVSDLEYQEAVLYNEIWGKVPDAPFKNGKYTDFVLKNLLRRAAEEGYGYIGWTTAATQDARWRGDDWRLGEDGGLSGNLKGYTIEYDQDMPKFLNKYGKQWGASVTKELLPNGIRVWSFPITEEMKQSVLYEGQPLYSERGSEYRELAKNPEANETRLRELLIQEAKDRGFSTKMLFHGTFSFGFTQLDTSYSDDGISFFATDNEDIARGYASGRAEQRDVSDDKSAHNYTSPFEKEDYANAVTTIREFFHLTEDERIDQDEDFNHRLANYIYPLIDEANGDMGIQAFFEYNQHAIADTILSQRDVVAGLDKLDMFLEDIDHTLEETFGDPETTEGIYRLYGNMNKMLGLDARGGNWNNIDLGTRLKEDYDKWAAGTKYEGRRVTTRTLAKFLKEATDFEGYYIRNIHDTGSNGDYHQQGTIYNFFYPERQVKSADLVTYDEDGLVIPLEERFNPENNDIRYSERSYNARAFLKEETLDRYLQSYAVADSPNTSQAWIARIDPSKFIPGTTKNIVDRMRLRDEVTKLDEDALSAEMQPMYLDVKLDESGKPIAISGHEGRHRSEAIANEGISSEVIILFDYGNWEDNRQSYNSLMLEGQRGADFVFVHDAIPLDYAHKDELVSNFVTTPWYYKGGDRATLKYSERDGYAEPEYKERADRAEEFFGTTTDVTRASWIVRDGKMLDFVNDGNRVGDEEYENKIEEYSRDNSRKDAIYLAEHFDHLDIGFVYDYDEADDFMEAFIKEGNIRVFKDDGSWESGYERSLIELDVTCNPTPAQYDSIRYMIEQSRDVKEILVEVVENGSTPISSEAYPPDTSADKIVSDIKYTLVNGKPRDGISQFHYSERDDRTILSNALATAAQNDIEKKNIEQYQSKITDMNAEQERLDKLRAEIRELAFAKGKRDTAKIAKLRDEATKLANRISIYDKQLLRLEATKPIQAVLAREKALAKKKAKTETSEAVKAYKSEAAERQQAIIEKYRNRIKKNTEGRNKTQVKNKIRKVVKEMDTLLNRGSKERNVKIGLRDTVSQALDTASVLFSSLDASDIIRNGITSATAEEQELIKKYDSLLAMSGNLAEEIETKHENNEDATDLVARLEDISSEMKGIEKSLKDVIVRERIRLQESAVGDAVQKLADSYKVLLTDKENHIHYSYQQEVYDKIVALKEKLGGATVADMSLEQLEEVYDAYKLVLHTVRTANKIFRNGQAYDTEVTATRLGNEIALNNKMRDERSTIRTKSESFVWKELKPYYAFKKMHSDTAMELYHDFEVAEDTWGRDVAEARDFATKTRDKYGYSEWNFDKPISVEFSGKKLQLTLGKLMSIYAYSKRDQALAHMSEGGFVLNSSEAFRKEKSVLKYVSNAREAFRVSDTDLLKLASQYLNEAQMKYVDEMQEYLTAMGEKGNEASRILYGIDIFKEKVYFPLQSAADYIFSTNQPAGEVSLKNTGMTKETVPHATNPIVLEDFDDVWGTHIGKMSTYHAFVVPIDTFNKVYNYTNYRTADESVSVKSIFGSAFGDAGKHYVQKFIQDLNGGIQTDDTKSPIIGLMSKFKKTAVAASASVIIQQPTAILRAMSMVDPKYFVTDLKMGHKAKWEQLKHYAPVAVIKEIGGFDTHGGRSANQYLSDNHTFMEKADDVLMRGAGLADEVGWNAIWDAVKRETKAKTSLTGEALLQKAGERFGEVVRATQVYDSTLSRSEYMRSQNDVVKMATAFMGEPTTSFNMLYDSVTQTMSGKMSKATAATTIASVFAASIAGCVLKSLVGAARKDDDDESYLNKYVQVLASNITDEVFIPNMLPFVKDVVSIIQGWEVERTDMSLVQDLYDAFNDLFSDSKSVYRKVEDFGGAIGNLLGIPAKNLMRDARSIVNVIKSIFDDNEPKHLARDFVETVWSDILQTATLGQVEYDTSANAFLDRGDTERAKEIIDETIAEKIASGKTEKEAKAAVRSSLTSYWKPKFLQAYQDKDNEEMARIRKLLASTGVYESVVSTTQDWIKSSK